MASYDYSCNTCDEIFELSRSMKENVSVAECPKCNKECKQVILKARSFDSYFEGSVKEEHPPRARW